MCAKKVCPFMHPILFSRQKWFQFKHRYLVNYDLSK